MMTYKAEEASSISIILTTTAAAAAVNCKVFSGSAFIHSLTHSHSLCCQLPTIVSLHLPDTEEDSVVISEAVLSTASPTTEITLIQSQQRAPLKNKIEQNKKDRK